MGKAKAKPGRKQRTVQICTFAASIQRDITSRLRENPTVVVAAAVLAFSQLSAVEQLDHIRTARQKHVESEA